MFNKDGFVSYVGNASGSSYVAGLKAIETEYNVDIEKEHTKDKCSALLNKIEQDKQQDSLSDAVHKKLCNMLSHLRKYVEFKENYVATEQRRQFVAWMKKQPRRDDSSLRYSEETIDAAANKLQYGLKKLGISEYSDLNCFTVTETEEFSAIYKKCFELAEQSDKQQGHRDFRNGLDFYLKFLKEQNDMDIANSTNIGEKIRFIIDSYKKHFDVVLIEEKYKWQAIAWYKQYWNIEAEDFGSMVATAFNKAGILLTAGMYYAYKVLVDYATYAPEKVRELFRTLYDRSIPLNQRYEAFRSGFEGYTAYLATLEGNHGKKFNHYQDIHAITVYLSFEYPEEYYIYKYTVYENIKERIGYTETVGKRSSVDWKYNNHVNICELIRTEIQNDPELLEMNAARLVDNCYKDPEYHLLAMDIAFYGAVYMEEDDFLQSDDSESTNNIEEETDIMIDNITDIELNTILYGPPGTGKTYHTAIYAVAIIENKGLAEVVSEAKTNYNEVLRRYNEYKAIGRIAFTTFHQSYGYEEFIEGIKPVIVSDDENEEKSDIKYDIKAGIFKEFCTKASAIKYSEQVDDYGINDNPLIWKVSLDGTGDNPTRSECLTNGHIRIGWDNYGKDITDQTDFSVSGGKNPLNAFINRMRIGDIVLSCYSAATIDAIGVVTGDYEWNDEYSNLKRLRKVNWIVKNINEDITEITNGVTMTLSTVYKISSITLDDVMTIVKKHKPEETTYVVPNGNYVFIIDEINRGNISKIFGELITLIESTKRIGANEEMQAVLPYSGKQFGVPNNVYIIGTMNTADRSIALLDTALRRRFDFREMLPDPDVLKGIYVEDLSVSDMLFNINNRIAVLYDREHTIGHAYFMVLKSSPDIDTLGRIFEKKIIPLLQEYFYEDYEKIRLVLGDNKKEDEQTQFIAKKSNDLETLFGSADIDIDETDSYEINKKAFYDIEAYRSI